MSARHEIEKLLFDYCWGIDDGDFGLTASLFGEAGLYGMVGADPVSGAAEVLAALHASVRTYDGVPRTRHVVTNVVIDLADDGSTGTARSYVQVIHQSPADGDEARPPIRQIVVGTYRDKVHLVDGIWQFAERRMDLQMLGDLSTHLQPGIL